MNTRLLFHHSGKQPDPSVPVELGVQCEAKDLSFHSAWAAMGERSSDLVVRGVPPLRNEFRFRSSFILGSGQEQFPHLAWKCLDFHSGERPFAGIVRGMRRDSLCHNARHRRSLKSSWGRTPIIRALTQRQHDLATNMGASRR